MLNKRVLVYEMEGSPWLLLTMILCAVSLVDGDYWFSVGFAASSVLNVWAFSRLGRVSKHQPGGAHDGIGGA